MLGGTVATKVCFAGFAPGRLSIVALSVERGPLSGQIHNWAGASARKSSALTTTLKEAGASAGRMMVTVLVLGSTVVSPTDSIVSLGCGLGRTIITEPTE